ncbi:MAG: DUF6148 family protein [Clostridiales bacterium]|nr:DUF6148 family protein [Clostridiales bacterium]
MKEKKRPRGITLKVAQKHLDEWLEAELEVTTHQSYTLGSQSLTMADLDMIGNRIEYWSGKVAELEVQEESGGRNRVYLAVPRDW